MDGKRKKVPPLVKEQPTGYEPEERYEIIGGIRYDLLPSPKVVHQVMSAEIEQRLRAGCQPDGVVLHAPMDVHLDKDNILQPDILYIANENLGIIVDQKIMGAPDLVVEILSQSTGGRDKTLKKEVYEHFGVKEYWIADPVHFSIDQFILNSGAYSLYKTYTLGHTLTSPLFPCIEIDLDALYKAVERFMPKDD